MSSTPPADRKLVCVAAVATAHGVRGALKLKCFTEVHGDVGAYGPLHDAHGRELFKIRVLGPVKGGVIVEADGITDRDAALALQGLELHVPRERLPALEEETFYYEDLVGLAVRDSEGGTRGQVIGVHDFGAGEVLEYRDQDGGTAMVAFTRALVPAVDVAGGFLVLAPEALTDEVVAA